MALYVYIHRVDASQVEFMLEMYDDIDWMDEPTETGWMPAPEQVSTLYLCWLVMNTIYNWTT